MSTKGLPYHRYFCMESIVAFLMFPVPLVTLSVLGVRCIKQGRFLDALPLLFTQFNSALVWSCLVAEQIGVFNTDINFGRIMKGGYFSLRNLMLNEFFINMTFFLPLNLFLYTWRFLKELEQEADSKIYKTFYRWFAYITILLVPLAFYTLVPAMLVEKSQYLYYNVHDKPAKYTRHYEIYIDLFKANLVLAPLTNLLSCLILCFVLKLIYNLSKKVRVGKSAVFSKNKVDLIVTTSHIVITLAFSLTEVISIFYSYRNYSKSYRM